jgi:hypothetical protein
MQSEKELAAEAERAALEKDLENWELSAEKERAEAEFDRERGKNLEEQLTRDLNIRRTGNPHTLTLGGQDKSPLINVRDFDYEKEKIQALVATARERELEPLKQAYLDEQKATRDLETRKQQEQQKTVERVQEPRLRLGQQPRSEQYRELREQTQQYKDQNIKNQQEEQDLERQQIRQPMRMTNESIERAVKEAKAQLERSKEQGLDYGRGLEHEI